MKALWKKISRYDIDCEKKSSFAFALHILFFWFHAQTIVHSVLINNDANRPTSHPDVDVLFRGLSLSFISGFDGFDWFVALPLCSFTYSCVIICCRRKGNKRFSEATKNFTGISQKCFLQPDRRVAAHPVLLVVAEKAQILSGTLPLTVDLDGQVPISCRMSVSASLFVDCHAS